MKTVAYVARAIGARSKFKARAILAGLRDSDEKLEERARTLMMPDEDELKECIRTEQKNGKYSELELQIERPAEMKERQRFAQKQLGL